MPALPPTTAHPLAADPDAGWWIERFGADFLLSAVPGADAHARSLDLIRDWCQRQKAPLARVFLRELVAAGGDQHAPELIHRAPDAPPADAPGEACEHGLRYGLDFGAYTVGLFLDQAQNRKRVATARPGERLLNLFAYTCSFSVAAAARGAETLSVDLARPALERGRANFALNGLATDPDAGDRRPRQRFLADDAFAVLPRLARRGERFDWIVLDPPTFSRGKRGSKKKVFRVERDLPELIALCWEVLAPGGRLLVSTNCAAFDRAALASAITAALREADASPKSYELQDAPTVGEVPTPAPATAWWVERA
ncbi:MAG: class I SAM-dependent methyltransferase [Verrucomicrobiota bacterium]